VENNVLEEEKEHPHVNQRRKIWVGSNGERESYRGAEKKKGFHEIETLNKPYGFSSFNNRSHIPLFGFGSSGPRHIILFGTDFGRTEAYSSLWLRVLAEPRHKTWLELQKCHRAIICFNSWPTEAYKAR